MLSKRQTNFEAHTQHALQRQNGEYKHQNKNKNICTVLKSPTQIRFITVKSEVIILTVGHLYNAVTQLDRGMPCQVKELFFKQNKKEIFSETIVQKYPM